MAEKSIPIRTCVCCRQEFAKKQLLRVVKNKDGKIFIDLSGKADGRGAYICKSKDCADKLLKKKVLNKVFACEIPESVYNELAEGILGNNQN